MDPGGDPEERAQLSRTAYHEAGHVVADWETDFPPTWTTVESGKHHDGGQYDGCTDSADEDSRVVEGDPERTRWNMEGFLVSVIAGEMAESLAIGQPVETNENEYEEARDLAARRGLSLPDAECRARDLLTRRWRWVQTIAEALLRERTLDTTRLHEIHTTCLGGR